MLKKATLLSVVIVLSLTLGAWCSMAIPWISSIFRFSAQSTVATSTATEQSKLGVGILKLEGTSQAVTAQQGPSSCRCGWR